MDRRLINRLIQAQPTRPDVFQAQRRMQLERTMDWLDAIAVTASRVGYRFEWRLSPVPVRWMPDDRGVPFDISNYVSGHGWVPLGQLYRSRPPTDEPFPNPDMVYPPYSADTDYVAWFARTVRTWQQFYQSQDRLRRRRELYAERRRRQQEAQRAGECVVVFGLQVHWRLEDVPARCLRWVDTRRPPQEPLYLTRAEALPENLHPCGVWGDLLESPTEREEMRPASPPRWPPPTMDDLVPPLMRGCVSWCA